MATAKNKESDKPAEDIIAPDSGPAVGNEVLQLTCNTGGHLRGETFRRAEADKLAITGYCRPLPDQADRGMTPPPPTDPALAAPGTVLTR